MIQHTHVVMKSGDPWLTQAKLSTIEDLPVLFYECVLPPHASRWPLCPPALHPTHAHCPHWMCECTHYTCKYCFPSQRCKYDGDVETVQYIDCCTVVCPVTNLASAKRAPLQLSLDDGIIYQGDEMFYIFGSPHMVVGGSWCGNCHANAGTHCQPSHLPPALRSDGCWRHPQQGCYHLYAGQFCL